MTSLTQKTLLAGLAGTALMTIYTLITPLIGLPKISPPEFLSQSIQSSVLIGWMVYAIIGIFFAVFYTKICFLKYRIKNNYLKGIAFGITTFIMTQILVGFMSMIFTTPAIESSKIITALESLMGHILFGLTVVFIIGNSYASCKISENAE